MSPAGGGAAALTCSKALQLARTSTVNEPFPIYVAFDFENDRSRCPFLRRGEIGGGAGVNGRAAERFPQPGPTRPTDLLFATDIHGLRRCDVGAHEFAEICRVPSIIGMPSWSRTMAGRFRRAVLERMTDRWVEWARWCSSIRYRWQVTLSTSRKLEDLAALYVSMRDEVITRWTIPGR